MISADLNWDFFWNLRLACRPCTRYSQDSETDTFLCSYRQKCVLYYYYYYYYCYYYYYYCHYFNKNK